ncbi:WLM-domain-containing protein [Athelia psychrophila]|uniref:WLM-domain-containing protein n=1 Tax=Athelia psychrophila TaxID=1759441 RepID=A0A166M9G2_9AGAM|nr:WLM-domain-containing protein [Fibularhizoctonia sp. CBS 109695]
MVHHRLNAKEANPNPHINFISVLNEDDDDALQLMRALAAQVRPLMKAHGFDVNSFEEYEFNQVFAGRNWNAGETVELVLRSAGGFFVPTSYLMSTLCHELAHIRHMHHGPDFQALWKQLNNEVRALQLKGYYGDGYWSAGTRLGDSTRVAGDGVDSGEFPEYMCGGAQRRTRPTARRRRRGPRTQAGPSLHTGRQTAKKRKAGARVTGQNVFAGEGKAINEDGDSDQKTQGTGFGKQASSKRAREERALAVERRLKAMQSKSGIASSSSISQPLKAENSEAESDSDAEVEVCETDGDRRKTMQDAAQINDIDDLKFKFIAGFQFKFPTNGDSKMPTSRATGSTSSTASPSHSKGKDSSQRTAVIAGASSSQKKQPTSFAMGNLVKDEVNLRKKESLGLALSGDQRLGRSSFRAKTDAPKEQDKSLNSWDCLVCTLSNQSRYLACSACATPKGESSWSKQ